MYAVIVQHFVKMLIIIFKQQLLTYAIRPRFGEMSQETPPLRNGNIARMVRIFKHCIVVIANQLNCTGLMTQ